MHLRATGLANRPGQNRIRLPSVKGVGVVVGSGTMGRTPVGRTFVRPRTPQPPPAPTPVDPPGIEPGLPACHTGVIPLDHEPVGLPCCGEEWNRGESNPVAVFARHRSDPSAIPFRGRRTEIRGQAGNRRGSSVV